MRLYVGSFHLNYCRWYVRGYFYKTWLSFMFVKWLLSYIHFIDWYVSFWIFVVRLFLAMLQKVIPLFDWEMNILLYPFYWSILYLLSFVCYFLIWILLGGIFSRCFTRFDFFVWLWNEYYFIFSLLIESFFP